MGSRTNEVLFVRSGLSRLVGLVVCAGLRPVGVRMVGAGSGFRVYTVGSTGPFPVKPRLFNSFSINRLGGNAAVVWRVWLLFG